MYRNVQIKDLHLLVLTFSVINKNMLFVISFSCCSSHAFLNFQGRLLTATGLPGKPSVVLWVSKDAWQWSRGAPVASAGAPAWFLLERAPPSSWPTETGQVPTKHCKCSKVR